MSDILTMNKSKKNILRYMNNVDDYKRVLDFFISIDDDFYPPLSKRPWGLESCLEKPLKQGKIVLSEIENNLVGVLAYYVQNFNATAEMIGVGKGYRKTNVLYDLIKYVVGVEGNKEEIKTINTSIWSSNIGQRKVLETLGFKVKGQVENDIVYDRTTIKYEADFCDISRFFCIKS